MASNNPGPSVVDIPKGSDGFYHPKTEDQIIALVKMAYAEGRQIRCRGSAHSLAWAIYTDSGAGDPAIPNKVSVQDPPMGPNINVMLDQFNELKWIDEENGIVEADAGINLGVDPEDPTHTSNRDNSLLYQALQKGWCLEDLGGIVHQTVGGFLSTGSAGGSLIYSLENNLMAFRVIDGMGNVEWFEKDPNDDNCIFNALGVSLGLLGIVTKVRFQLTKNYFIYGQQITAPADSSCPIDLFGSGNGDKPGMKEYLEKTPYSRIIWWPQKNVERVVIWEATRGAAMPVFYPAPYKEFAPKPFMSQVEEMGGAILFTLVGNKGFFKSWSKLQRDFGQFRKNLCSNWKGKAMASVFSWLITALFWIVALPISIIFGFLPFLLRALFPTFVQWLQPLTKNEEAQLFMDYTWNSLPMDTYVDDVLMGTEFTEIWIPLEYTERAMKLLKTMFDNGGYATAGFNMTELYAGKGNKFWLSPAYETDVFRVDPFWYINNEGNPGAKGQFYSNFWELFRENKIPFRLHWAKFLPEYDYKVWAEYFEEQYPRWNDFMALRSQRDPKNIFLTAYWKKHLFGE